MKHDHYTYRVTWSEEDREHVGLCAEFPALSWLEPSPEKALAGIRKLVADCVKDMEQSGEAIPHPLAEKNFGGRLWSGFRRNSTERWQLRQPSQVSA